MRHLTERLWRILSSTLAFGGGVGAFLIFLTSFGLIFYYSANRPHIPRPELGWTMRLPWPTWPPSYGTAEEYAHQLSLHWWGCALGIMAGVGVAIRKLKVERKRKAKIAGHYTENGSNTG